MSLIKSVSGIRGTIGGKVGYSLTPIDITRFTAAFATWIQRRNDLNGCDSKKIVIGRDARVSGHFVAEMVKQCLMSLGFEVVNLGLSTTPTVAMNVVFEKAAGGIVITASHNPEQWNALKLLNEFGEFISPDIGSIVLDIASQDDFDFVTIDKWGKETIVSDGIDKHIDAIINHSLVLVQAIKDQPLRIVVDAVNSTGAIAVTALLARLGIKDILVINSDMNGHFAHNPEPLPEHLSEICSKVKTYHADLGIVVDPDVDRLCFVCENGELFGEEYTLVAVADYVLNHTQGPVVSNLSSSRALRDIATHYGCACYASAVGEFHVVAKMKAVDAVLGGEGNGGIILPDLHYGRDALIGIALFLSLLTMKKQPVSKLRLGYPNYVMDKLKYTLPEDMTINNLLIYLKNKYTPIADCDETDGLKIDFPNGWLHIRASNTEPILRVYAEHKDKNELQQMVRALMNELEQATVHA
ncbi:MAG: phosphoglucosamine mutase [Phycisphaerales bacterium]|nr:phosphoglucosamine mutase [Phycisphaerales bacterium]